jgi:broad specificity phosphatase PhoE
MIEAEPSVSDALSRVYEDRRAFQKILEGAMTRWISGEHDRAGVESWASFKRRVREGMHSVMEENGRGKVLAIFTSGGPLSVAMQMALGLSDRETLQLGWQIVNTSVSTFKYNHERLTLESFNGVAHLELTGDQKLITYR